MAYPVGPQPGYPTGPQPPAAVTAKRIPEDLPFVVRPNVRKRALVFGAVILVLGLVLACPMGAIAAADDGSPWVLLVIPMVMLLLALQFGFMLWLIASGGPVLAVGPDGLWIRSRPTRGQAVWLPWGAIDHIYPRRWSLEKLVCVKPRDPRLGSGLGTFTAVDSGLQKAFFGTGFTATLNFADRSEEEIMRALAGYAAGRCRVG
ncbi:hypothetical protein GA0070611_3732 [Micromonospora auratinigra]|uniref:PH domain-containing protein n=1 Tax=Micromonospora auratinigra TaxID=261654 RepID=A0A1A8ZU95_9ACTN|nr:hypothetical protein GA0070611_3732 [Micromonospora auratinigra]